MKPPARGSSFRKKWSMSPTSPSIREQNDTESAQNEAGNIHEGMLHYFFQASSLVFEFFKLFKALVIWKIGFYEFICK